jgi:hypothetical protein
VAVGFLKTAADVLSDGVGNSAIIGKDVPVGFMVSGIGSIAHMSGMR